MKCIICNNEIPPNQTKHRVSKKRQRTTCSNGCHRKLIVKTRIENGNNSHPRKYTNGLPMRTCERCGKSFRQKGYYRARFCSWHCAHIIPKGEENWSWKGGKTRRDGYILISKHGHPFVDKNGYIYEHRFIMEQYIDRHLTPNERVHHLNGIKEDNRIENLSLVSSQKVHKFLHPNITCPHCGKQFVLVESKPIRSFI